MVQVIESAARVTPAKKTIDVRDVAIMNNCLVDIETGETDVLEQIKAALPENVETISFKIRFEIGEDI